MGAAEGGSKSQLGLGNLLAMRKKDGDKSNLSTRWRREKRKTPGQDVDKKAPKSRRFVPFPKELTRW